MAEQDYTLEPTAYPAPSRTSTVSIADVPTTCSLVSFSDRILLTVSQDGRLAHWLLVPLTPSNPLDSFTPFSFANNTTSLLPSSHLTASPLFGLPPGQLATFTQLLATQTGSLITQKTPSEARSLVVGVGFSKETVKLLESPAEGKKVYEELLGLVLEIL